MNKMIKWLGNYWISGTALIMLGFSIALNFGNFSPNDTGIILTFVGIIATFIVVGNYAQVTTIKNDFKESILILNSKQTNATNKIEVLIEENKKLQQETKTLENRVNGSLYQLQSLIDFNNCNYISFLWYSLRAISFYSKIPDNKRVRVIYCNIMKEIIVNHRNDLKKIDFNDFNKSKDFYSLLDELKESTNRDVIDVINQIERLIADLK